MRTPSEQQLRAEAERLFTRGEPLEEVLAFLRRSGCSMGDSVLILSDLKGIELEEAQELVVNSDTWEDRYVAYSQLEDAFWSEVEQMGERQSDGSIKIDLSDL